MEGVVLEPDRELLRRLRGPFPESAIDKLPRGLKRDAPKQKCRECGGYHEPAGVHLDYVGHAHVTARLLDVDPCWSWEPLALDEHGLPRLSTDDKGTPIGLWIRLTVAGMTRLGFGELPAAKGADGIKEAIGDAIRNAAMRFGVALELWARGLELSESSRVRAVRSRPPREPSLPSAAERARELALKVHGGDVDAARDFVARFLGDRWTGRLEAQTPVELDELIRELTPTSQGASA